MSHSKTPEKEKDRVFLFKYKGDSAAYMEKLGLVRDSTFPGSGTSIIVNLESFSWNYVTVLPGKILTDGTIAREKFERIHKRALEKWVKEHPARKYSKRFGL